MAYRVHKNEEFIRNLAQSNNLEFKKLLIDCTTEEIKSICEIIVNATWVLDQFIPTDLDSVLKCIEKNANNFEKLKLELIERQTSVKKVLTLVLARLFLEEYLFLIDSA